ncbi:MAG: Lrp/AsnC family transcriptional regulator [Gemmatimonadota bacterium]|jgi:Lrp/AsnC family leucine-responsive transcriptional regulator
MRGSTLDEIDKKLLDLLQADGRMSQQDLADAVGLSSPATGERIRKLVQHGIIKSFSAVLDADALGHGVTAFIFVSIDGSEYFPEFVEHSRETPEILECHAITGAGSHMLKIRTSSTSSLERLLATIQSWPGVSSTTTSVVLSVAKESLKVPLDQLPDTETIPTSS